MNKLMIVVCFSMLLLSKAAHAGWQTTGAACTPDPASVQANLVAVSAGAVGFASGAYGQLTLYCPITNPESTSPSHMYLVYEDSDGTSGGDYPSASYKVKVNYYRMSTTDGSISQIVTVDTDTCGAANGGAGGGVTTGTPTWCEMPFTDSSYNTSSYYYYVRIDITRTSTTTSDREIFYGMTLY